LEGKWVRERGWAGRVGGGGQGSSNRSAAVTMHMLLSEYEYLHWCDDDIIYNKPRYQVEIQGWVVGGGCSAGREIALALLMLLLSAAVSREIYN